MAVVRCSSSCSTDRTPALSAFAVLFFAVLLALIFQADAIIPLPADIPIGNYNPYTLTVSGISSGACMALQFQYAWSSIVRGAGLIAAAPYLCAAGLVAGAELCLNTPWIEAPAVFFASAETRAAIGLIDPLENLQNQTIFLLSGTLDTVVPQPNMDYVALMFDMAGARDRVTTLFDVPSEHAWITSRYGNNCSYLGTPYVNDCGVDFAGAYLKQAFEDLALPWNATEGRLIQSNFFSFDQLPFGASPAINSLAAEGYLYIPTYCQQQSTFSKCHLHVNLHGCQQDFISLGTNYLYHTQLNEWAESNHMVILYPQATANDLLLNPMGCFDWWGYAGETYAVKAGAQISVIRAMIAHFGGFYREREREPLTGCFPPSIDTFLKFACSHPVLQC